MANPNPVRTGAFIAQHSGEFGAKRKTFGVRFSEAIESQLLKLPDAYDFIRQAVAAKLLGEGGGGTISASTTTPSSIAPGKLLQIPNRKIEIRAIVDNQVVYRYKSEVGWQYAVHSQQHIESLIRRKAAHEVSKL